MWGYTYYIRGTETANRSSVTKFPSIINRISPSVEPLLAKNLECQPDDLLKQAVHANINSSVDQLRHESKILERLIRENMLLIVGAEYSLENGIVSFFDKSP